MQYARPQVMSRADLETHFRRGWLGKVELHSHSCKNRLGTPRKFSDFEDLIPKTGIQKNKSQTSDIFYRSKTTIQLTTIHHQNTATSPQKTTPKHTHFLIPHEKHP
jgi:hypothetical protein